jgi:hypothetical protein
VQERNIEEDLKTSGGGALNGRLKPNGDSCFISKRRIFFLSNN